VCAVAAQTLVTAVLVRLVSLADASDGDECDPGGGCGSGTVGTMATVVTAASGSVPDVQQGLEYVSPMLVPGLTSSFAPLRHATLLLLHALLDAAADHAVVALLQRGEVPGVALYVALASPPPPTSAAACCIVASPLVLSSSLATGSCW
jgi:hypothetical protein